MRIDSIARLSLLTTLLSVLGCGAATASELSQSSPSHPMSERSEPTRRLPALTPLKEVKDLQLGQRLPSIAPPAGRLQAQQQAQQDAGAEPPLSPLAPIAPLESPPSAPAAPVSEVRILSPQAGTQAAPFTNLVVQYPVGTTVKVRVNQTLLDDRIQTQVEQDPATNGVTQVWYRVPLASGENRLTVEPSVGSPASITVTVQETATRLEFLPVKEARVRADGRSATIVEGQVLTEAGAPVAKDVVVTLTTSSGQFIGADYDTDRPGFQVLARGGKFAARLQSSLEPQMVRVRAAVERSQLVTEAEKLKPTLPISQPAPTQALQTLNPAEPDLEAYTQVEFIADLRPTLLSGNINLRLGPSGVNFYDSFRDFLRPSRLDDDVRFDFGAAVFATGSVGEWRYTGAFNNQRSLNENCDGTTRLYRDPQFCDQVYPVYGDSSTVDYLTPSIDSVYLRLERTSTVPGAGADYFMWGDYSTQEFARASQFYTSSLRQLHGFKGTYNLGDLQITALFANNVNGVQRDTIAPNGTSGYYFLSRRLVVGGSETVFVETEELGRPGTVLERKPLSRSLDYEIDYDRGALLFRRPIVPIEFDLFGRTVVQRIVVNYQFESIGNDGGDAYAGRLQYNLSREIGRESWVGATYWTEDQGDRTFELYGADLLLSLGNKGQLIAEFARSSNDSVFLGPVDGNAYRVEVHGAPIRGLFGRAYYRSVEEGFANNATFSFAPGQTRYGAELAAKLSPQTQLQFSVDREENFGIASAVTGITAFTQVGIGDLFNPNPEPIPGTRLNNSLTTVRAGVVQKMGAAELGLDWVNRSREDRNAPGLLSEDSSQIVSRLLVPLSETLAFRAQDERNLGDEDPIYPDRTTLALDWKAMPGVTIQLAQQFIQGGLYGDNSITSLNTFMDQKIGENTTLTGRYSILNGVNGLTGQSAIGLNHRIVLAPGLRMNLAYERIAGDIFLYTGAGQQFITPGAVGQSAAVLGVTEGDSYSVGLDYTDNPNFKASARFEYRDSNAGDNMVISAAAAGKLSPSLTALVRYQQANFANQLLTNSGLADSVNLKLGLAYRNPANDKFNALLRYEYRQNPGITPETILVGRGTGAEDHLVALEAIYAPSFRWELYGKFALRDTKSYLARDLLGTNAITLGQLRATHRIGYRWDVAGEVRWIGQSVANFDEVGWVAELGYYLTPDLRMAVGYNFGKVSDRDFGDRSKDGFFVGLSLKLNNAFGWGAQELGPSQQLQESKLKPVATQAAPAPEAAPPASAAPEPTDGATPPAPGEKAQ